MRHIRHFYLQPKAEVVYWADYGMRAKAHKNGVFAGHSPRNEGTKAEEKPSMTSPERKFGKYAIRNLTLILILCYIIGYTISFAAPGLLPWLTLNPALILRGQVWRLITWLLIPPEASMSFFTVIMLFFYYSIGMSLERAWGAWQYNVYIFSGILFTIIGAFLTYLWVRVDAGADAALPVMTAASLFFSTYYINLSLFLAYAATFPEAEVLLMFFIPVKVKYLGILYAAIVAYEFATGFPYLRLIILASLLNFLIFFFRSRNWRRISPSEIHRRQTFQRGVARGEAMRRKGAQAGAGSLNSLRGQTMHRCAVCGRTEKDDPNLEFRYCSKCAGGREYCQEHLFTHVHVTAEQPASVQPPEDRTE